MNPEQRRAHLVLHGQTLLDAWQERCKLRAEADRLSVEAGRISVEPGLLRADAVRLSIEAGNLYADANKFWVEAVRAEFGNTTMVWTNGACTLGVGEHYEP